MEETTDSLRRALAPPASMDTKAGEMDAKAKAIAIPGASLEQNFPNPFSQSTTIHYSVPQTFRSAKIVITDTSGRIFKQTTVSTPGAGSVMVEAGYLPAGAYFYSLYVDNTLVDTKKMVLTKF